MRKLKYFSPSSYQMYCNDPKRFYVQYLATVTTPRMPQTVHMAMGSAFDAFVKSQITADLGCSTKFETRELFEEQVAPEFWDELWDRAQHLLDRYMECGAYAIAVEDMGLASLEPRFEFGVEANIHGVPCFGKPDAFYVNQHGTPVILDWKVNSYLGGRNAKKLYYVMDHQNGMSHSKVVTRSSQGLPVAVNRFLEDVDTSWAFQQFVYAIGLGSKIGDMFITSIDQVTGGPSFYTYRAHLSKKFQYDSASGLKEAWEDINSGYVFKRLGLTREESDRLIEKLEGPQRDLYF